jgi:hypothetical protein
VVWGHGSRALCVWFPESLLTSRYLEYGEAQQDRRRGGGSVTKTVARPPLEDDNEELRSAVAMLGAMIRKDVVGIQVLGKHTDTTEMMFGFAALAIDALGEPSTTDIAGYVDRLFARLDRGA